jgi:hypothetical protein
MSRRGLGFSIPSDDTRYNDAYVTWLLHCEGAQGSTYALDSSAKQNGPVVMSNTFITGSTINGVPTFCMHFPANALAYSPVNVDNSFNLGFNDFTIDWWEYRVGDTTVNRLSFVWDTLPNVYCPMLVGWGVGDGTLYFYASNDAANWNLASAMVMGTGLFNQWVHRAIVRKSGTFYGFQNGILQGTQAQGGNGWFNPATYGPCLGCWPRSDGYYYAHHYIDEFRVSNGIARWTANFTVPVVGTYVPDPDMNTVLLMHFDDLTDASQYKRGAIQTAGAPVIASITRTPFGGSRALYLGAGANYLGYPDSADWVIGTKDFTVDCWVYLDQGYPATNNYAVLTQMNGGNDYNDRHLFLYIASNGSVVSDCNKAGVTVYFTGTGPNTVPLNAWTHLAVVRNGTAVEIYVNGVKGSGYVLPANTSFQDLAGPLRIGTMATDQLFKGYIDEVRFTIGRALWTANFTPPNAPYPRQEETVLLLHYDNGFDDSSQKRRGRGNSNASITTAQKKFGTQSLMLSGAQYHWYYDAADFDFDNGDFTIDCWLYSLDNGSVNQRALFGAMNGDTTNVSVGALLYNGTIYCSLGKTGSDWYTYKIVGTIPFTLNTWHHYALVRTGNIIKQYIDGVLDGTPLDFGTSRIFNSTAAFIIGAAGNAAYYWNGYLDEFRITKGRALWTANFTPPTAPST